MKILGVSSSRLGSNVLSCVGQHSLQSLGSLKNRPREGCVSSVNNGEFWEDGGILDAPGALVKLDVVSCR
jgi:hypothetical protein